MNFFDSLTEAVEFASELLQHSPNGSVSITTTLPGKFVVFSAPIATSLSLADTGNQTAKFFSETQPNT